MSQTWPDNREPTAEEFVTWFERLGYSRQLEEAAKIVSDRHSVWLCQVIGNHVAELEWLSAHVVALEDDLAAYKIAALKNNVEE